MPICKRKDIPILTQSLKQGEIYPVYLLFGERYLCRDAANTLINRFLPDEKQKANNLYAIDGEQEDPLNTLNLLRTYSLFPGRRVVRVMDSRLFHSKGVAKKLWDKAKQSFISNDLDQAGRSLGRMLGAAKAAHDMSADELGSLSASRWKSIFGFAKPNDVSWLKKIALPEETAPDTSRKGGAADLYIKAFENGLPPDTILILVAEAVDRRKQFYKYIQKHGVILDLSVDTGISTAARKSQEALLSELVHNTLAAFGKKLGPKVLDQLLERVGFYPVAAVMEAEKLALSVDDALVITTADLDAMVGRTREEALFELTETVANRDLAKSLLLLSRLRGNGTHPLVIVAGLRNHIKKILLARSLQDMKHPMYSKGMSFGAFQKGYLPILKEEKKEALAMLPGHPYALYMMFKKAADFSPSFLQSGLTELLDAEYYLKGSALPDYVVLENFLFRLFIGQKTGSKPMAAKQ